MVFPQTARELPRQFSVCPRQPFVVRGDKVPLRDHRRRMAGSAGWWLWTQLTRHWICRRWSATPRAQILLSVDVTADSSTARVGLAVVGGWRGRSRCGVDDPDEDRHRHRRQHCAPPKRLGSRLHRCWSSVSRRPNATDWCVGCCWSWALESSTGNRSAQRHQSELLTTAQEAPSSDCGCARRCPAVACWSAEHKTSTSRDD